MVVFTLVTMPRKNKTPKHQPYQPRTAVAPLKKRFSSRQAALLAIKEVEKYHLDIALDIYQSPVDGGWYLTSRN